MAKETFVDYRETKAEAEQSRDEQAELLRKRGLTGKFGVSVRKQGGGWAVILHEY